MTIKSEKAIYITLNVIEEMKQKILNILSGDASLQAQDEVIALFDELAKRVEVIIYED